MAPVFKYILNSVNVLRTIEYDLYILLLTLFPYGKFRIIHSVFERKIEKFSLNFLHPTLRDFEGIRSSIIQPSNHLIIKL